MKGRVAAGVGSTVHVKNNGLTDGSRNVRDEKAKEHVVTEQRKEGKWLNMRGRTTDSKGHHFDRLQKRAMAMFVAEKVGGFIHIGVEMCLK